MPSPLIDEQNNRTIDGSNIKEIIFEFDFNLRAFMYNIVTENIENNALSLSHKCAH
jgi:hypothetical protein